MTVKEFYNAIGENYDYIFSYFRNDERIKKYVKMFYDDKSYATLLEAINAKDYELAFRMIHTIKGMCLNLGFQKLLKSSVTLTELLRGKSNSDINDSLLKDILLSLELVTNDYNLIMNYLKELS